MMHNAGTTRESAAAARQTSRFVSILAWVILLVPDGWGLYLSLVRGIRWLKS